MRIETLFCFFVLLLGLQTRILSRTPRQLNAAPASPQTAQSKTQNAEFKLMNLAASIKAHADQKGMKIRRLRVGKNLRKVFEGVEPSKMLEKFINDPKLESKIQIARKTLQKKQKEQKPAALKPAERTESSPAQPAFSDPSFGQNGGFLPNFAPPQRMLPENQLAPGIAGSPFPSFLMNGPHYEPPMKITVNSLPDQNPRARLSPSEIQLSNIRKQTRDLEGLYRQFEDLSQEISSLDNEMESSVEENYGRALQLS